MFSAAALLFARMLVLNILAFIKWLGMKRRHTMVWNFEIKNVQGRVIFEFGNFI